MSVARSTLSPWAQVGIAVSLTSRTRSQIIDTLLHSPTLWDFALWHGGFAFSPNVYPSGENYLFSNAAFNVGHLSDGALDAAIAASLQPRGSLAQYDAVARAEAPEVWMPTSLSLCEARHLVTGPINPLEPFSPELWHR
jgi:peptide/nickel transport system substrate-binding protein